MQHSTTTNDVVDFIRLPCGNSERGRGQYLLTNRCVRKLNVPQPAGRPSVGLSGVIPTVSFQHTCTHSKLQKKHKKTPLENHTVRAAITVLRHTHKPGQCTHHQACRPERTYMHLRSKQEPTSTMEVLPNSSYLSCRNQATHTQAYTDTSAHFILIKALPA